MLIKTNVNKDNWHCIFSTDYEIILISCCGGSESHCVLDPNCVSLESSVHQESDCLFHSFHFIFPPFSIRLPVLITQAIFDNWYNARVWTLHASQIKGVLPLSMDYQNSSILLHQQPPHLHHYQGCLVLRLPVQHILSVHSRALCLRDHLQQHKRRLPTA